MSEQKRTPSMQRGMDASTDLRRTMKTRNAIMVGVGGTLKTGIFLSSGDVFANEDSGSRPPHICSVNLSFG